jgi:meiotically up-regulated gene 157 (Mug157) protein
MNKEKWYEEAWKSNLRTIQTVWEYRETHGNDDNYDQRDFDNSEPGVKLGSYPSAISYLADMLWHKYEPSRDVHMWTTSGYVPTEGYDFKKRSEVIAAFVLNKVVSFAIKVKENFYYVASIGEVDIYEYDVRRRT